MTKFDATVERWAREATEKIPSLKESWELHTHTQKGDATGGSKRSSPEEEEENIEAHFAEEEELLLKILEDAFKTAQHLGEESKKSVRRIREREVLDTYKELGFEESDPITLAATAEWRETNETNEKHFYTWLNKNREKINHGPGREGVFEGDGVTDHQMTTFDEKVEGWASEKAAKKIKEEGLEKLSEGQRKTFRMDLKRLITHNPVNGRVSRGRRVVPGSDTKVRIHRPEIFFPEFVKNTFGFFKEEDDKVSLQGCYAGQWDKHRYDEINPKGKCGFVMDTERNIYAHEMVKGIWNHWSLLKGAPVLAAGSVAWRPNVHPSRLDPSERSQKPAGLFFVDKGQNPYKSGIRGMIKVIKMVVDTYDEALKEAEGDFVCSVDFDDEVHFLFDPTNEKNRDPQKACRSRACAARTLMKEKEWIAAWRALDSDDLGAGADAEAIEEQDSYSMYVKKADQVASACLAAQT